MTAPDADDARLERLDYYTLLGVSRDASPDDVRDGFRRFAQRYHPDLYTGSSEAKITRANKIYRRGTEAYRVLLDSEQRRKYDAQLSLGKLRYDPSLLPPAEAARRSIPPAAMPTARAAQAALRSGDFAAARSLLREALVHDPKNEVLLAALADVEKKMSGRS